MSDDAKKTILSSIPLPGALAVLTALAGVLLLNYEPLVPRRPVEVSAASNVAGDVHRFSAAPGEDPLLAMVRARVVSPNQRHSGSAGNVLAHSPSDFFEDLQGRLASLVASEKTEVLSKVSTVLLMPVLLRPGDDIASIEQRSRARTAVTAGLTASGYVPEHNGSLECCRLSPWPNPSLSIVTVSGEPKSDVSATTVQEEPVLDVAFEWFKSSTRIPMIKKAEPSNVVVLWMRGDAIETAPVATLRTILHRLLVLQPLEGGKAVSVDESRIRIALIGPHSTDNLVGFIHEALADKSKSAASLPRQVANNGATLDESALWKGPLRMISPWATASAQALLRLAGAGMLPTSDKRSDALSAEKRVDKLMQKLLAPKGGCPTPFIRSLTTDDYVAEVLVDELELRGLSLHSSPKEEDVKDRGDHVAIISEFDTSYGRELPLTFIEATMSGKQLADSRLDLLVQINKPGFRWHWINFPRGLDGRFSADSASSGVEKTSSDGRNDPNYAPDEVPIGANHADALRRLAAQLEELDENLSRRGGKGLVAVGVLGGDVYDKLWILRALRPRLPHTQFFTNNLDAWLWQRDELRTTRNLIVGSPYGVTLAPEYQMGKLPFRDSYQTSVYAATLAATEVVPAGEFAALRSTEAVRRFEIGRSEPHDLSLESRSIRLHPQAETHTWWQLDVRSYQAWSIVSIVFVAWIGWMIVSRLPGLGLMSRKQVVAIDWRGPLVRILKSPSLILVLGIFVSWRIESWWSAQRNGGEPLLFASGISAWPGQAFRLMALLLALYLVARACATLADSTRELRARYFADELKEKSEAASQRRPPGEWFKSMFLLWDASSMITTRQGEENIVHPVQLWSEYRLSNSITARLTRSLVIAILMFAGACLLLHLLGETLSPVRGERAREIDWWLDRLSLAALLWITAFVVDMLWLNRVFIHWFNRGRSDWPEEMLNAYKGSGLHADNLRDYIDLQMVADWTRDVGRLTFFPFYVLALLILARMNRFDSWSWPSALIIVYAIVVLLVILGAARVRSAAESLRSRAVAEARQRHSPLLDDSAADKLLREINGLSRGAFVPFSEQPVMKALYWLLGALGVGGLWQAFARWS